MTETSQTVRRPMTGSEYIESLRDGRTIFFHGDKVKDVTTHPAFNPHFRQLLHVAFKVAAQMGDRYLKMLVECEETIAQNVTNNLYDRHLRPLFVV